VDEDAEGQGSAPDWRCSKNNIGEHWSREPSTSSHPTLLASTSGPPPWAANKQGLSKKKTRIRGPVRRHMGYRRPFPGGPASEQPGLQAGPHGAGPQLLKIEETIFLNFSNHAFYLFPNAVLLQWIAILLQ